MLKEQLFQKLTKYHTVILDLKLNDKDIQALAQWLSVGGFNNVTELDPSMFDHPRNKELFALAVQTGVFAKGVFITCPFCGEKTGYYNDLIDYDIDRMPKFSRCSRGHTFESFQPAAKKEVFFCGRRTPCTFG